MSVQHHTFPTVPGRVVVFGSSGFVGRHLLAHLREELIPTVGIASADLDLTHPTAAARLSHTLQQEDAVVFLAALTPDKGNDIHALMRNLAMAHSLAALDSPPSLAHVIYVSSDAVYSLTDTPLSESSVPDPPTLYGHMHLLREKMVAHLCEVWRCPLLIVRPCALFGPGDTHNSYGPNRFIRSADLEQRITLFGDGEEQRDHLYVLDFVRLLGLCLRHRSAGLVNAATGASVSFLELATQVAGQCAGRVDVVRQPRRTPVTHRHFDISALIRAFPAFRFTQRNTALRATADALRVPVA